jgi:hypothetical protein
LFETDSRFAIETPILMPCPLWTEVAFRDTVSSRFALAGTLRLGPTKFTVVDDEVVTVVVLIEVLVTVLVAELVTVVVCGNGFVDIVTVEINEDVVVWVVTKVEVWVTSLTLSIL